MSEVERFRKGRMVAMSDEIDALIDAIAARESQERRGRVVRADLIEEWARAHAPADWQWPPVVSLELSAVDRAAA